MYEMYASKLCHTSIWEYTQEVWEGFQREEQVTKLAKPWPGFQAERFWGPTGRMHSNVSS